MAVQGASSIFGLRDIGIGLFFIVVQGSSHCVGLGIFRPLRSVKVSHAHCGRSFSAWPWYSLGREDGNWQYEAIKQAVADGLGLSILSLHALGPDAAPGSLVALNVEALPIRRHWYIVRPAGKRLSVVAKAFFAYLKAEGSHIKFPTLAGFSDHVGTVQRA
jgi:DNA-binding transcriptional LysR family regulator